MVDITTDQRFASATLRVLNIAGQDAGVESPPVWSSSDPSVIVVTQQESGLGAVIDAVGPGSAHAIVTADADLGPGVTPILGTSDTIIVTASPRATALVIDLGSPSAKV